MSLKPEDPTQQPPSPSSERVPEGAPAHEAQPSGELERTPLHVLSPEELHAVSNVGGVNIQGFGVLQGQLKFLARSLRVVLITANPGTRSEVSFITDLPAEAVSSSPGKRVSVSGIIRKQSLYSGTLTEACLVGKAPTERMPGQYLILEGVISNRHPIGIGGEAAPTGSWLVLASPIHIGKLLFHEVYLVHKLMPDGTKALLHGRLGLGHYGGVETPRRTYASLSGISDLAAGEPRYDGKQFWSQESDEPLRMLVLGQAHLVDVPSRILVLEPARQLAFVGTWGGLLLGDNSPFHGFYAKAAIEQPTEADLAAIRFDEQSKPVDVATGEPLVEVAHAGPEKPYPDALYTTYYWDEHVGTVYVTVSGGFAGFHNHVQSVIHVPRHET